MEKLINKLRDIIDHIQGNLDDLLTNKKTEYDEVIILKELIDISKDIDDKLKNITNDDDNWYEKNETIIIKILGNYELYDTLEVLSDDYYEWTYRVHDYLNRLDFKTEAEMYIDRSSLSERINWLQERGYYDEIKRSHPNEDGKDFADQVNNVIEEQY